METEASVQRRHIRIKPLDIGVTPLTSLEAAQLAASGCGKQLILSHNLHSAYLHGNDREFRELYRRSDWVVIDGTPILWLASLSAGERIPVGYRISSTDWIEALSTVACPGRIFVYGAKTDSNASAVENLRTKLPSWSVSGIDGYVDDQVAISLICEFKPSLVIVGLGMPNQEHFLFRHWNVLPVATYATVGGAIDYVAGTTRLAPRWLGILGVEWLWRLANEPRRLAFRYLVEPWLLAWQICITNFRGVGTSDGGNPR